MEDRNYKGMKTDGGSFVVELEKGIESRIPVYKYNNHHKSKNCAFHIAELYITMDEKEDEAVVTVYGSLKRKFSHLDGTMYFVYGDIVVPAQKFQKCIYQATILPNLPGGVIFFVSLDGVIPASQVMKFKYPSKPTRSAAELILELRLANLLLHNNENREELISRLRECDDKDTHSEILLKRFLGQWLFEDRKSVYSLDEEGLAVIHLCASLGYAWAIAIIRRFHLTLDLTDGFGWTPLHWAAFHGRRGASAALLIGGADPALRTERVAYFPSECITDDTGLGTELTTEFPMGCTARDIAARRGHHLLAAYLEEPAKVSKLHPLQKKELRFLHTYRTSVSSNCLEIKADGVHHVIELEKGLKCDLAVYEYQNHHQQQQSPFRIEELYIDMDHTVQEPVVKVFGDFQTLPAEANPLFVFGDLVVPAKCVVEGAGPYKCTLLPNLPEYDFYVSLDGFTPISQVMKFKCSCESKKMSDIELGLESRLFGLLVVNKANLKGLTMKFREQNIKNLPNEMLIRELLKEWILESCKIGRITDAQGQGVLHLVACLGYTWAIALCTNNGFPVDSKDTSGWTALHWAAYYGRKGAVMTLLISGADPYVVCEPTIEFPIGCKAADIAYSRGHDDVAARLEGFPTHRAKKARLGCEIKNISASC